MAKSPLLSSDRLDICFCSTDKKKRRKRIVISVFIYNKML